MARKLRIEYPGAIYHVMNRGDRREPIFKDDRDRRRCLDTLAEACAKTHWQVQAWCLMRNHFHLVVETPEPNLVLGMKWFLGTYTGRFNRRHKLTGHLFSGRYKALIVDGSGNGYLRTVCDYVHLNPVRAKLLPDPEPLRTFPWSSYRDYLEPPERRPEWLRVDRLFGELGIPQDSPAGRKEFERRMEERRHQESGTDWKAVRGGWCLGPDAFREELLAQMNTRMGEHHYGLERSESSVVRAERIVKEELERVRWTEAQLQVRPKSDAMKLAIAIRLREETPMSLKWISERLATGAWTHLNRRLYEHRRSMTVDPGATS